MGKSFAEKLGVMWGVEEDDQQEIAVSEVQEVSNRQVRLEVVSIRDNADLDKILSLLNSGTALIASLENIPEDGRLTAFDVLCGVVYAYDGSIERIRSGIYVMAPVGVRVSDEQTWLSLYNG